MRREGKREELHIHTCLLGFKCVCVGTLSSHFKALSVIELQSVTRSLCVYNYLLLTLLRQIKCFYIKYYTHTT